MNHDYALLVRATAFAVGAHGDQKYGDKPYFFHLTSVEQNVIALRGVEAYRERIVALLHDVIEDTHVSYHEVMVEFGEEIADDVWAMTKVKGEDYYEYIERVLARPVATLVKKCDTMANLTQSFKEQRHKGIIKYTTQLQLLEAK